MLRRMLRVDNWLDVAPLKNMEEDHSFLFLKKNLMKIFFFFFGKLEFFKGIENFEKKFSFSFSFSFSFFLFFFFFEKFGNLEFFQGIWKFWLMIFFFFWKQPKKYEPNAPSPKAFFENFLLFFFFKDLQRIFFFFLIELWRFVHYQKVKKMKMKME